MAYRHVTRLSQFFLPPSAPFSHLRMETAVELADFICVQNYLSNCFLPASVSEGKMLCSFLYHHQHMP